jgi:CRP/FNR family transcriptional regulator, nitrogen fixation regulation protein
LTVTKDNIVDLNGLHSSRRPTVRTPTKEEARRFPPGQRALHPGTIGTLLKLARHQKIFSEGEAADHFYLVVSGAVRTYTVLPDGRRIIDGFHLAGDIFGLETLTHHRLSANGIVDVTVLSFRRRELDMLTGSHSELGKKLQSSLIVSLARAQDHVLLLGRKTAAEKVAGFLLEIAQRVSKSKTAKLPMSHADVADYLGLCRETVSRVLSNLSSDGMVDVEGPRLRHQDTARH